jgi:hypothetical protein
MLAFKETEATLIEKANLKIGRFIKTRYYSKEKMIKNNYFHK